MILILDFLGFAFAKMPLFIPCWICRILGYSIFYFYSSRRHIILRNLSHCFPERTEKERRAIALESCCRTIEMGLFALAYSHFSKKQIYKHIKVDENSKHLFNKCDVPIISAIPHLTLLEALTTTPLLLNEMPDEQSVFFRPFKNVALNNWVKRTRERWGAKLISRKEGLLKAKSTAINNGVIGILFDQNTGNRSSGALSLFCNRITGCSELVGVLAQQGRGKVIMTYCKRKSFWKGNLTFEEIPEITKESDAETITILINKWLEDKLYSDLDFCKDWLWLHDRWKMRESLHIEAKRNILEKTLSILNLKEFPKTKRLWIRLPNWLGDIVMAMPLIQTIKNSRPDIELTLLTQSHFIPLLETLKIADSILPLPSKGLGYLKKICPLKKKYPDIELLFTNSLRSDIEAKIIDATHRYGIEHIGKHRLFLNHKWKLNKSIDLTKTHQTKLWKQWLSESIDLPTDINFSPIKIYNTQTNEKRIGLICGSENSPEKRWSIRHWKNLITLLQKYNPDIKISLFGTKKDLEITSKIITKELNNVENRAGKTNLKEYLNELSQCSLIIGNDTGGLHLANMIGIPVIGIFGPTNPIRTGPIFDAPIIILQPENCPPTGGLPIDNIPAERVVTEAIKFL